ncbi:MAG TPA: DUF4350 domain-containing protein [Steroidobacter sp.]|uniref:DUF4350 domain-containing protein n=1 Tax=Steroidobacter sp. TaxID=1978227 RepID=UPI002ED81ABF
MYRQGIVGVVLSAISIAQIAHAQAPIADVNYAPAIPHPAFSFGSGPVVRIDEAHRNYHTLEGRYAPFASLLRRDGFQVERSELTLSVESLAGADVLVIVNAMVDPSGQQNESALSDREIRAVHAWVTQGGALLIVADHPPFSNAASALAKAFGLVREGPI